MAFNSNKIRGQILSLHGVKAVQVETVWQVIVTTSNGRNHETIENIRNLEIEIIKQNPLKAFDFSVVYGPPDLAVE